jgi:hypothetical protein
MSSENAPAARTGSGGLAIGLAVGCLGLLGYGAFYSGNTISDPAFLAGQDLVYGGLLWGVFCFPFIRRRNAKTKAITFLAIFGSIFVGGLISASRYKSQARLMLSSVQRDIARLSNEVSKSGHVPAESLGDAGAGPQTSGELGEMERFIRDCIDRTAADAHDYNLEVNAIGWNSILDAQRLEKDPTLSESRLMISRAKSIVDKYELKSTTGLKETRERISTLPISEEAKAGLRTGFDRNANKGNQIIQTQWQLERQIMSQFENIISLMADGKGWRVKDGRIVFQSSDDLAQFRSFIEKIGPLTERQEQAKKDALAEAQQMIEAGKAETTK